MQITLAKSRRNEAAQVCGLAPVPPSQVVSLNQSLDPERKISTARGPAREGSTFRQDCAGFAATVYVNAAACLTLASTAIYHFVQGGVGHVLAGVASAFATVVVGKIALNGTSRDRPLGK